MTTISTIDGFIDELHRLLETKDNPDEWYVLSGRTVGEYSIHTSEKPEEIPEEYELCGMCLNVRLGKNPEEETVEDIADDIRELTGVGGDGPTFTKSQLRQLRAYLEERA